MKKIISNSQMFAILAFTSILLISCSKQDDVTQQSDNPQTTIDNKLASISIQNTKALFISTSNTGSKLYGVKSSTNSTVPVAEEIFEIKYLNSSNQQIIKSNPSYIYNLQNYLVLAFGTVNDFEEAYLIKKSDGKVFQIPQNYLPHVVGNKYNYLDQYINTKNKIQEDQNNNIYYTSYPNLKILKVSLNTPTSLQFEEVSAVNDGVRGFCVDKDGNISYGYYDSNTQSYKYRYRKVAGNFVIPNFPTFQYYNRIWTGTNGQIYAANQNTANNSNFGKIVDGNFIQIRPSTLNVNDWQFGETFNVQGKIIYTYYSYNPNKIFNFSNEAEFAEITCNVNANYVINNNLYNFNKPTFVLNLINISNGSNSLVYDLDESLLASYDIDKIINVAQDGVTFSAVNLNNGQYVVAKISTSNIVTIQQTLTGLVTTITPIN